MDLYFNVQANPSPDLLTVQELRDILARWSLDDERQSAVERLPITYFDDTYEVLLGTLESLGVVATESMQHQVAAEVFRAFAMTFERIPQQHRARAEDAILRLISGLGDHVLTIVLEDALRALAQAMEKAGAETSAAALRTATSQLSETVGRLNSRSTRVSN